MGFLLPLIFAILSLVAVALANHAAQPAPQLYWNSILPNTQMPRSISELLRPDSTNEEKSTNIMNAVGNGKPTDHKGKPENIPLALAIYRDYGHPTDIQLDYKNAAIFFLEKDMRPGATTNYQFPRNSNTATFLPRESAQSIPFSSNKLSEIFNHFSVKPTSAEAKTIKQTIEASLRSLEQETFKQSRRRYWKKEPPCHAQVYNNSGLKKLAELSLAVFYCHAIKPTAAYVLSLKGDDGVKVKAVAICHLDTSEWNPKHLAFQILKVKPGTIPICHFLPTDHIVWAPNHKSA
ncbi:BURP domain-containing protein [Prunus dulcis]|uniref:BURP domain-containing protein n=1 Tax=Prunus dulcis TaxID=3755 RepID=A0A5H2XWN3_PRUDU|nr:BURP domain-containing protein [Prunus dulcis]